MAADHSSIPSLFAARHRSEGPYGALADPTDGWMPDHLRQRFFAATGVETELASKAPEGAVAGGMIGATVGAIIAATTAMGSGLNIPELGLAINSPLAAAFAGAGAGALSGTVLGALVGFSMLEERLRRGDDALREHGRRAPRQLPRRSLF